MGEDVGETSNGDDDQVEMDLEITILMIVNQENVVFAPPLPKQNNVMRMLMHILIKVT